MTNASTSTVAISINSILGNVNTVSRLARGGKDFSIKGKDVEKAITKTTDYLGDKFYKWFW